MNKIALVTGSNRGIGFATVKELLIKGYTTILTSRNKEAGEKAAEKLKKYGKVDLQILDITNQESIKALGDYVNKTYGKLHTLINNAAINYDTWHNASNANLTEVRLSIETNIMGAWAMTQAFIHLLKNAENATIVNVSSGAGAFAEMSGGTPSYSITKAALNVLTIKFASDLKSDSIIVNSVCPGWVRTDMGGMAAPRSAKKGAETIIWASELTDINKTGKFYRDQNEIDW